MNYQVTEDELLATADAIRLRSGGTERIQWESEQGFADAVADIPAGGILVSKSVTANGTYSASSDSADGYSSVTVDVPGATLVEKSITANGNYYPGNDDADGYSAVYVAVEGSNLVAKTVTENGVYDPEDENVDGYLSVTVNVPNTYEASDEGKVVSEGALVSQTSTSATVNGTLDTTLNNEVVVNVPNTYEASDEGKVVDDGALVSQTSTTVTTNGTVDTTLNDEVVVSVPNTYESSDEGKVVSSGALVSQTSTTKTANGTYDTTLNNEVIVNVAGASTLTTKSITANGTYDATDDSADGYSSVTVNVESSADLGTKSITANGTYAASADSLDGYSSVTVNVSGGGGSSGVYVGTADPDASQGNDGEYYYKRRTITSNGLKKYTIQGHSGQNYLGYEFTANENFNIMGFRVYVRDDSSVNANVIFGDLSNVLYTTETITPVTGWNDIILESPISVIAGETYIVKEYISQPYGGYGAKNYVVTPDSRITPVQGRYGSSWPGSIDGSNIYSADIIIAAEYMTQEIVGQYHKENGAWTQIA